MEWVWEGKGMRWRRNKNGKYGKTDILWGGCYWANCFVNGGLWFLRWQSSHLATGGHIKSQWCCHDILEPEASEMNYKGITEPVCLAALLEWPLWRRNPVCNGFRKGNHYSWNSAAVAQNALLCHSCLTGLLRSRPLRGKWSVVHPVFLSFSLPPFVFLNYFLSSPQMEQFNQRSLIDLLFGSHSAAVEICR